MKILKKNIFKFSYYSEHNSKQSKTMKILEKCLWGSTFFTANYFQYLTK